MNSPQAQHTPTEVGGGVDCYILFCFAEAVAPLPFLCFPTHPPLRPSGQALPMCVGETSACLLAHFRQFPMEIQGIHISDIFPQGSHSNMWLLWQPLPFS